MATCISTGPSGRVLVVVPHGGTAIPPEIPLEALSDGFDALTRNIDWYTDWLYDFRDLLDCRRSVFPYCSLLLEANRHPEDLQACVPTRDVFGRSVYREGREPPLDLRKRLVDKYLNPFHRAVSRQIEDGADFLLDGHSTITARGVADHQIELMSFQDSERDAGIVRFCPDDFVQTYAAELRKLLPDVRVTVNASEYHTTYGHVCALHSVAARERVGSRVPAVLQETNDRLYRRADGTVDLLALNRLRRAFAEAMAAMLRAVRGDGEGGRR